MKLTPRALMALHAVLVKDNPYFELSERHGSEMRWYPNSRGNSRRRMIDGLVEHGLLTRYDREFDVRPHKLTLKGYDELIPYLKRRLFTEDHAEAIRRRAVCVDYEADLAHRRSKARAEADEKYRRIEAARRQKHVDRMRQLMKDIGAHFAPGGAPWSDDELLGFMEQVGDVIHS